MYSKFAAAAVQFAFAADDPDAFAAAAAVARPFVVDNAAAAVGDDPSLDDVEWRLVVAVVVQQAHLRPQNVLKHPVVGTVLDYYLRYDKEPVGHHLK